MGGKRKLPQSTHPHNPPTKRLKLEKLNADCAAVGDLPPVQCHLLSCYYTHVTNLKSFILDRVSRARRRKIAYLSRDDSRHKISGAQEERGALSELLESTLVGISNKASSDDGQARLKELAAFSQQQRSSSGSGEKSGVRIQAEIVDFAIWTLFNKSFRAVSKPSHLLCQGYQRSSAAHGSLAGIPGLALTYPNPHISILKSPIWSRVLAILGDEGERIMLELMLDDGIFIPIQSGSGNYCQLSGIPLCELQNLRELRGSRSKPKNASMSNGRDLHNPGSISFVRYRMFYARPALNAAGEVKFGLRHIHVFNRFHDCSSKSQNVHIMKYIFPRQFKLHNVFTSTVNPRETVQHFKDYTLREQEIRINAECDGSGSEMQSNSSFEAVEKLPKRLRGMPFSLVGKMRELHRRCAYVALLRHYCPDKVNLPVAHDVSFFEFATPMSQVSAFCRAVIFKVFPFEFWGIGEQGSENRNRILHGIDCFIRLRKYESFSLHDAFQGIKLSGIAWLVPPSQRIQDRLSAGETGKRQQIFLELLYYLYDSFLIPLIRSNFYVTESNVHRNRIFYFRHDTWRLLTVAPLQTLRLSRFEMIERERASNILENRILSYSQIRLLPKKVGVRPIMNLRRRMPSGKFGQVILGRSINSCMAPIKTILNHELSAQPGRLGSAMFSVGDMYLKLKSFKGSLQSHISGAKKLYFAKVDVMSCFDTIPQQSVIHLVENLICSDYYFVLRHAEMKFPEGTRHISPALKASNPFKRFLTSACTAENVSSFLKRVEEGIAPGKKDTMFINNKVPSVEERDELLWLLRDHVARNIVKIGKRFFRQKDGVPQGSVLSALLCNLFYADLERQYLSFADEPGTILFRLIDDFLLITTKKEHAQRFLQTFHDGIPSYGIAVNTSKSLANFSVEINGERVHRTRNENLFPYCGNLIDTKSLQVHKDGGKMKEFTMTDSLTVEYSRAPGKTFHRKSLNAFKIQVHAMFLDTCLNSLTTVLKNLYESFQVAASRMYNYVKSLPREKQPRQELMINVIRDLMRLSFVLMRSKLKHGKLRAHNYQCSVSKAQINWLAATAFREVFIRRQSANGSILTWLDQARASSRPKRRVELARMQRVVCASGKTTDLV